MRHAPIDAGFPVVDFAKPFGCTGYMRVTRARSEGSVWLQSRDWGQHPLVETAYYSDPDGYDLRVMTEGMRPVRRLFEENALSEWRGIELAPGLNCRTDGEIGQCVRETSAHAGWVVRPTIPLRGPGGSTCEGFFQPGGLRTRPSCLPWFPSTSPLPA